MKIFVLVKNQHYYRDGGNDIVEGVFRDRDEAFAKVCEHIPDAPYKEGPAVTWEAPGSETFGDYLAWTIEEHELI